MPLEVTPHPVLPPLVRRPDEAHASYRGVSRRGLVLPVGADLEYVDGLTRDRVSDVELGPDVLRWATAIKKPPQRIMVARSLCVVEGHTADRAAQEWSLTLVEYAAMRARAGAA